MSARSFIIRTRSAACTSSGSGDHCIGTMSSVHSWPRARADRLRMSLSVCVLRKQEMFASAQALSGESLHLKAEVQKFLDGVRAA